MWHLLYLGTSEEAFVRSGDCQQLREEVCKTSMTDSSKFVQDREAFASMLETKQPAIPSNKPRKDTTRARLLESFKRASHLRASLA